jgi:uncharacterized protein YqjF (DUF2071 family)
VLSLSFLLLPWPADPSLLSQVIPAILLSRTASRTAWLSCVPM